MGHANAAAALRYQHATADRDQSIARALSELAAPAAVVPIARNAFGARDKRAMDATSKRTANPGNGA
jgi:hypothetical protein